MFSKAAGGSALEFSAFKNNGNVLILHVNCKLIEKLKNKDRNTY